MKHLSSASELSFNSSATMTARNRLSSSINASAEGYDYFSNESVVVPTAEMLMDQIYNHLTDTCGQSNGRQKLANSQKDSHMLDEFCNNPNQETLQAVYCNIYNIKDVNVAKLASNIELCSVFTQVSENIQNLKQLHGLSHNSSLAAFRTIFPQSRKAYSSLCGRLFHGKTFSLQHEARVKNVSNKLKDENNETRAALDGLAKHVLKYLNGQLSKADFLEQYRAASAQSMTDVGMKTNSRLRTQDAAINNIILRTLDVLKKCTLDQSNLPNSESANIYQQLHNFSQHLDHSKLLGGDSPVKLSEISVAEQVLNRLQLAKDIEQANLQAATDKLFAAGGAEITDQEYHAFMRGIDPQKEHTVETNSIIANLKILGVSVPLTHVGIKSYAAALTKLQSLKLKLPEKLAPHFNDMLRSAMGEFSREIYNLYNQYSHEEKQSTRLGLLQNLMAKVQDGSSLAFDIEIASNIPGSKLTEIQQMKDLIAHFDEMKGKNGLVKASAADLMAQNRDNRIYENLDEYHENAMRINQLTQIKIQQNNIESNLPLKITQETLRNDISFLQQINLIRPKDNNNLSAEFNIILDLQPMIFQQQQQLSELNIVEKSIKDSGVNSNQSYMSAALYTQRSITNVREQQLGAIIQLLNVNLEKIKTHMSYTAKMLTEDFKLQMQQNISKYVNAAEEISQLKNSELFSIYQVRNILSQLNQLLSKLQVKTVNKFQRYLTPRLDFGVLACAIEKLKFSTLEAVKDNKRSSNFSGLPILVAQESLTFLEQLLPSDSQNKLVDKNEIITLKLRSKNSFWRGLLIRSSNKPVDDLTMDATVSDSEDDLSAELFGSAAMLHRTPADDSNSKAAPLICKFQHIANVAYHVRSHSSLDQKLVKLAVDLEKLYLTMLATKSKTKDAIASEFQGLELLFIMSHRILDLVLTQESLSIDLDDVMQAIRYADMLQNIMDFNLSNVDNNKPEQLELLTTLAKLNSRLDAIDTSNSSQTIAFAEIRHSREEFRKQQANAWFKGPAETGQASANLHQIMTNHLAKKYRLIEPD